MGKLGVLGSAKVGTLTDCPTALGIYSSSTPLECVIFTSVDYFQWSSKILLLYSSQRKVPSGIGFAEAITIISSYHFCGFDTVGSSCAKVI